MRVKIRTHKATIMSDLEVQLAQQAPTSTNDTSMLFELPSLTVDGIPAQLDKMTQVISPVLHISRGLIHFCNLCMCVLYTVPCNTFVTAVEVIFILTLATTTIVQHPVVHLSRLV